MTMMPPNPQQLDLEEPTQTGGMNTPNPLNPHPNEAAPIQPVPASPGPDGEVVAPFLPGQHPFDQSTPSQFPGDAPVPANEGPIAYQRGFQRFSIDNGEGTLATYQRAAHDFTSGLTTITPAQGPLQIANRQKGRESVTLSVPSTATYGVAFAGSAGELQGAATPAVLNPGDSLTIASEASVWISVIGSNATGTVQYLTLYNPAGGELGGL